MRIKLYDRGTAQGKKLFDIVLAAQKRLLIEEDPEWIKDMHKMYSTGITGTTILTVDNEVVLIDRIPTSTELESILSDFIK